MPKTEWGTKRACGVCGARFYDMKRSPIFCPKCGEEVSEARQIPQEDIPPPEEVEVPEVDPIDDDIDFDDEEDPDIKDDDLIEDASELLEEEDENVTGVVDGFDLDDDT